MEFEGIVIRVTPFRDYDAMVNVLGVNRLYSFLAPGVLKMNSKLGSAVNIYSYGRYQSGKGKEGYRLRNAELLNSFENIKSNLTALAVADFLGEITNQFVQSSDASEIYPFLKKALEALNDGFDPKTIALIYFAKVLNVAGYGLDVDSCVKCGKTKAIVAVSYKDGGFICEDCFDSLKHLKCDAYKLKVIRYIFKVDIDNFTKVAFIEKTSDEILGELNKFIKDVVQIELKSIKLLRKI